ncbi:hypothetical protein GGR92_002596 [Spirosoma lacussanchae]|uniref:hypothetical protein n=1 Tax=Spirosoma lacussanchae TaxID=1884249 RepID=UPI001486DF82|nr:hypothetical protein [Spirosoma lacussanchae]
MYNALKQISQYMQVVNWSHLADRIFRPVIMPNAQQRQLVPVRVPVDQPFRSNRR